MKLVSFHLMPYRPLDLEEAAKHRSPWVVLPNRLYDPVKGAEEYARHIDALVYAEELGFDAIGANEHHQTAYGLMPAPNLIASALIQRTKRVKIAILGRALPLVRRRRRKSYRWLQGAIAAPDREAARTRALAGQELRVNERAGQAHNLDR